MSDLKESCQFFNFITCAVIIGVICICGLIGNATSFLVLCKHKTETTAVFLLECMTVADSVLLINTLFIYSFTSIHPYTERLFALHNAAETVRYHLWPLAMMTHTMTIWLTVLVTWSRFCAVCHPLSTYKNQSITGVRCQVFGILIFSVLYNLPRFFEHQPINKVQVSNSSNNSSAFNESFTIDVNLGDSKIYQIIYSNILYFPVMYIVPLLSLGYLNVRLIGSLKAIKKKKETLTGHKPRQDNITECIVAIVCIFILFQTPALVNQIFWAALDQNGRQCGKFHFYYTKISDALVVLNSSCNFIVYVFFVESFRNIFLEAVCICQRKYDNDVNEMEVTNGLQNQNDDSLLQETASV